MTQTTDKPLDGRVALITGANTGIGRVTAHELAKQGAHVFIACRSAERAQPVFDEIRAAYGSAAVELLALDLGDFDSIRQCAQTFLARGLPLHLLINNAGLAGARGLTKSGFELAFGTPRVMFRGEYDQNFFSVGFCPTPDGRFLMNKPLLPDDRALHVVVVENFGEEVKAKLATVAAR